MQIRQTLRKNTPANVSPAGPAPGIRRPRPFWPVLVLLGLLVFPAISLAEAPDSQTKILANGLKVVYHVQPEAQTVCVRVVVPAGLIFEPHRVRGISHLLEHMIFRGSAKIKPPELYKLIDDQGGYRNGFTYPDRTEYYMEVLPANFLPAMTIYNEFIFRPELSEKNIQLEKKIISVENALRSLPSNAFFLYMNELTQHQFDDSLTGITRDDLVKYHQQFYRTDRLTFIVTGAFKPDDLLTALGKIPASQAEVLPPADWIFHDPTSDIVLGDYLPGEKYQALFGFELKNPTDRELVVAKVLPYILAYESHQYDHVNDRPLDYQISLYSLAGHYFLVFIYRDTTNPYSLEIGEWHQKNLARYFKYLQAKDFDPFLTRFSKFQNKLLESLAYDPESLNKYLTEAQFDRAGLTRNDLGIIRRLTSKHFKEFVQKYLAGKYYQKIVVKAMQ